jgi:hypothetical protein
MAPVPLRHKKVKRHGEAWESAKMAGGVEKAWNDGVIAVNPSTTSYPSWPDSRRR